MITITYYGHSCFAVGNESHRVILDPYQDDSVPGLKLPDGLQAEAVYCSHEHHDHNGREKVTVNGTEPFPVSFVTVPHDDANGKKRGMTKITMLDVDGVKICHMGDIGRLPTKEETEFLKQADVLMIPCGGFFTIDAVQAKMIVDLVRPQMTILMHYRTNSYGYDQIESISTIRHLFPGLKERDESSVSFEAVPMGIYTFSAKQSD